MRRAGMASLLWLLLLPAGALAGPHISSAVRTRVAHPLGRLLGAIPARGVSLHVGGAAPRFDAGPQPPPPNAPSTCPAGADAAPFALCWFQGPVLHSNSVYTIFWNPPGLTFDPGYVEKVRAYFADQAAASGTIANVYSTATQYYDAAGNAAYQSSVGGSATDTSMFPLASCVPPQLGYVCVSDTDLTAEIDRVIAAHGWPRGLGPAFFVFLPKGASVCATVNGMPSCAYKTFCAYHSAYSASGGPPTLYAVEPYAAVAGCDTGQSPNASSADAVINTASHEHNEMITDPLGDGWVDLQGNENGDKCASAYGQTLGGGPGSLFNQVIAAGHYFLQEEFSNFAVKPGNTLDNGCAQSLPVRPPTATFAATSNPVITGQPASFSAAVASPDSPVASVTWDFGDTGAASGTTVSHVFAGVGPHTVTLSAVNAIGLRTRVARVIQVAAPDPRAAFSTAPNPVRSGHPTSFDGSASSEPGGAITRWAWNFGDGTLGTGRVVSHSFKGAGARTVTLLVSDSTGVSGSTTQRIEVQRKLLLSFALARGQTVRSVLRRGLRVRVRCSEACRPTARVAIGRLRRRGHGHGSLVVVKLGGAARQALRARRRLTLRVSVAAGGQRDAGSLLVRLRG